MLTPLIASAGRVTFRWDPVQFADRYELRVVSESALQTDFLRVSTIQGTAKDIARTFPVGAYRVLATGFQSLWRSKCLERRRSFRRKLTLTGE
jgi:hypothetical protein